MLAKQVKISNGDNNWVMLVWYWSSWFNNKMVDLVNYNVCFSGKISQEVWWGHQHLKLETSIQNTAYAGDQLCWSFNMVCGKRERG